jgi:hypothetical protein
MEFHNVVPILGVSRNCFTVKPHERFEGQFHRVKRRPRDPQRGPEKHEGPGSNVAPLGPSLPCYAPIRPKSQRVSRKWLIL